MQSSIITQGRCKKSSFSKETSHTLAYCLGIDISKDSLDVCLGVNAVTGRFKIVATRRFPNQATGFKNLTQWLGRKVKDTQSRLLCVMEATGVYYENLALYLDKEGFGLSVVLPSRAKLYLRSLGHKSKNDKMDSIGLSQMGFYYLLDRWKRPSDLSLALRQTTRFCESCQVTHTSLSNQLHALELSGYRRADLQEKIQRELDLLQTHIDQLKQEVEEMVKEDPEVYSKIQNITSIKGVGVIHCCCYTI
ncbi:MAG: transposase [Tannerellaceae bacterium]|nr:transposase [Tannerellaceae bacterium]